MVLEYSGLIPWILGDYDYWRFIKVQKFLRTLPRDPTSGSLAPLSTLGESLRPSTLSRSMVRNAKFEVENFDGTNNFYLWQCEPMNILFLQDLQMTFEKDKSKDMMEAEW